MRFYLILTFWTNPHALRNGFQGWIQAIQVIDTRTRVTHEQLATASAHSAEILMDVPLSGKNWTNQFWDCPPSGCPTNQVGRGKARRGGGVGGMEHNFFITFKKVVKFSQGLLLFGVILPLKWYSDASCV